jgi:hypothetical protein
MDGWMANQVWMHDSSNIPSIFSVEISPSLVDWCTALPVMAFIRDGSCVQDKDEININILCFHVWLHACVGRANPILFFFKECFNWILKMYGCCHLVIILSELSWVDEAISFFQIHDDLKG